VNQDPLDRFADGNKWMSDLLGRPTSIGIYL
jgi:hypothetical protein